MADTSIGFLILAKDQASGTFNKVGKSAEGAGSKVMGFGKFAVAGLAGLAGGAVATMGTKFIGAASDMNETLSKSRVIFGAQAKSMEKWAGGAWRSMGMSKQAALEASAGFGDMFSQLGFAGNQASAMSKKVVQMSADLGSFNNLPTAEVADMMSGAFRGEYDSLQRLIPNINGARVEQEAMARTGKKSAKELTAQEKAAATLAIVTRDGARASGDFARTSNGLANQQKILKAKFEDVSAQIGQKLLPIAVKIAGWLLSDGVPAFAKFATGTGVALKAVYEGFRWLWNNGIQPVLKFIVGGVGGLMGIWAKMLGALGKVPGFGWAKDAGKAMGDAADKVNHFGDSIKKIPDEKKARVKAGVDGKDKVDALEAQFRRLPRLVRIKVKVAAQQGLNLANQIAQQLGLGGSQRGTGSGPTKAGILESLFPNIEKHSVKVGKALERVRDYVSALRDKLAGLRDVKAGFLSTFQGSSIFGTDLTDSADPLQTLLDQATKKRDRANALNAAVKGLISKGLSKDLLTQMQGAGEGGIDQILALSKGDAGQIASLNALNAQEQAALGAAGMATGNAVRGGSIDSDIARTKNAEAIAAALAKQLSHFNAEIHIHMEGQEIVRSVKAYNRRLGVQTAGI